MARARGSSPYSKVMANNVGPIIPIRKQILTVSDDTPVFEEVELHLDMKQVFDIFKVRLFLSPSALTANPAKGLADVHAYLLGNPESTVNADTVAQFIDSDVDMFYYFRDVFGYNESGTAAVEQFFKYGGKDDMDYKEPVTVSRNFQCAATVNASADFIGYAINARFVVYGRYRMAPQREWEDLMARERGLKK